MILFVSAFQSTFGTLLGVIAASLVAFVLFIVIAQIMDKWAWWSGKT